MKKTHLLAILIPALFSCSSETSINDLDAKDGVAYDPETNQPFNGKASLDFYDGTLRMEGDYKDGVKFGEWKYYVQGSKSRYYKLQFEKSFLEPLRTISEKIQWKLERGQATLEDFF